MQTRTLYRPVGLYEMALIYDLELRAFPPRLVDQPIVYPVLNREYAMQIARELNAPSEQAGYTGFVTQFEVYAEYLRRFEEQTVGGSICRELWVPAERRAYARRHR